MNTKKTNKKTLITKFCDKNIANKELKDVSHNNNKNQVMKNYKITKFCDKNIKK